MAMACMCGVAIIIGWAASWRLMRTFSSPSVISISPMPDSWTRSISFFSFLRSIPGLSLLWAGRRFGEGAQCRLQGGLVAHRPQAADHAGGDVREIRVLPEGLAGVHVG